ncbi:MAG: RluA family pseudouridine synthase [Dysgonomonas sp.]
MKKEDQDIVLQTLKVTENSQLLAFLVNQNVKKNRSRIKSLLSHKQVKVNNKISTQFDLELKPGDVVTIHKESHKHDLKNLEGVTIVYEDEDLLVVHKEPKLLSIATDREKRETAYSIISQYLKTSDPEARVFVLHRLDRDTSGLMLFAKSTQIQENMQRRWDDIILVRSYIAVVEGRPIPPTGTIMSWLTEDKNLVMHSSQTDNGGQRAITNYETVKTSRKFTMLRLNLETGRKNQIRVHMQSFGHPIVGDKKYGSHINPIKRMALHAHELKFIHPTTGETLEFKSPIPEKIMMLVETKTTMRS